MNRIGLFCLCYAISVLCAQSAFTQTYESLGSDVYVSGSSPEFTSNVPRDAFVVGFSPSVKAVVAGDLHISGFNITSSGEVGQDFYAAGANVTVNAHVKDDLSAVGFTVTLSESASIDGNVRIAAGTTTIDAPVGGSLLVSGGEIKLNSVVEGDVRLTAAAISFGSDARIAGKLIYSTAADVDISNAVIPPERVQRIPFSRDDVMDDVRDTLDTAIPSFWPSVVTRIFGFLVLLAFMLIVAGLFQAYRPEVVGALRKRAQLYPAKSLLSGFLGLATLVGLIPVSIITIVGIPLVPLVMLFILLFWLLGYLLGAYVISMRLYKSFADAPETNTGQVLVLAAGLVLLALINFIPVVGWLFNLTIVLLGLGAITVAFIEKYFNVGQKLLSAD